jgi:hypothetical protein
VIARLRARHVRLVLLAALVAGSGLWGALAVRHPAPVQTGLPPALSITPLPDDARLLWERVDLWAERELVTRVFRADGYRLELRPRGAAAGGAPAVLLDASRGPRPAQPGAPAPAARQPADAR